MSRRRPGELLGGLSWIPWLVGAVLGQDQRAFRPLHSPSCTLSPPFLTFLYSALQTLKRQDDIDVIRLLAGELRYDKPCKKKAIRFHPWSSISQESRKKLQTWNNQSHAKYLQAGVYTAASLAWKKHLVNSGLKCCFSYCYNCTGRSLSPVSPSNP